MSMTYEEAEARRAYLIGREAGRPGRQGKVNAKCIECIFDPGSGEGNWKQQVEACTCTGCPLFSIRPVSRPKA